jgi:hypothetical protein
MKDLIEIIGIKTLGDLKKFKEMELDESESFEDGLKRYVESLGTDFKLEEQK